MLDYQNENCVWCNEKTVIFHQYVGDSCCESCGEWQEIVEEES